MPKRTYKYIFLCLLIVLPTAAISTPLDDKLMGSVQIRTNMKLDGQARKEISNIAAKIKKSRIKGTVKLRGDCPAAENADEYLIKSVFMAREVEQYLKSLLSPRQQIYIMTNKFSGDKRVGPNVVELFLYPKELLVVEELQDFRVKSSQALDIPPQNPPVPETDVRQETEPAVMTPQVVDGNITVVTTERVKSEQPSEDATLANELVNRVKARAAQRAKRTGTGN